MKYRPDIDGLRAIAVVFVVLFHAFPKAVHGGFIGVDVFFVISGFLITSLLLRDLETDNYSFSHFYARRIRRIFPALLCVLFAALALGWFALYGYELEYVSKHVAGGIGFISNFLLWNESGYFDADAEMKPLLHLWSLSIEEQFYLVWPLLLFAFAWIANKKTKPLFLATLAMVVASFAANIYLIHTSPVADFYFPVSRAWELLAGGLLAFRRDKFENPLHSTIFATLGLIGIIVAGVVLQKSDAFPGWLALLPVVATAMLLATEKTWIHDRILSNRVFIWFGLISYPLYLWHWPLLSYLRIWSWGKTVAPLYLGTVLALSVLLSWLTYRFVEKPIRFDSSRFKVAGLVAGAFVVLAICGLFWKNQGFPERPVAKKVEKYNKALEWVWVKTQGCEKEFGDQPEEPFCIATVAPKVFLLGDSHANQLFPGLYGANVPVLSAGNGVPIDDVVVLGGKNHDRNVISLEKSKAFLTRHKDQIKVVVIAAAWEVFATGISLIQKNEGTTSYYEIESNRPEDKNATQIEKLERSLLRTIDFVQSTGAKIVIVIDPPEIPFVPADCFRNTFADGNECPRSIPLKVVLERQKDSRAMFDRIRAQRHGLFFFDPLPLFCDQEKCPYFDESGVPLYRDGSHISEATSRNIGKYLGPSLMDLISKQ